MIGKTKIIEIAGVANNGAIGKNNDLVVTTREDMKTFREMTTGKTLYLGYNTLMSFPKQKPLKNRDHIVYTRKELPEQITETGNKLIFVHYKEDLEKILKRDNVEELVVVGGARVYKDMFDYTDELILTEFDVDVENADVYFPKVEPSDWNIKVLGTYEEENIKYKRKIYTKKKKESHS